MAALVVRRELTLVLGQDEAPTLGAEHDFVLRLVEVLHRDLVAVAPGGKECGLVTDVLEIGPAHPGRAPRDECQLDVFRQRQLLGMNAQDALPALQVGEVHDDLAVEAPWPQKRRVEHVRPVRGREQDHALVRLEAVHLYEKRVERLLPLVVATTEASAPVTSHGVDLVDEDDARRVRLSLLEQVTHARGTDAHEHLDEVRARHLEERAPGFARHRPGEKRLAGPRRADQQYALRQAATQPRELRRVLQELDDLLELLLRLVGARHVGERDLRRVRRDELRLRATELERPVPAALHRPEDPDPEGDEEQPRERAEQERPPSGLGRLGLNDDVTVFEVLEETVRHLAREGDLELDDVFLRLDRDRRAELALDLPIDDRHLVHVAFIELVTKVGIRDLRHGRVLPLDQADSHKEQEDHHQQEPGVLGDSAQTVVVLRPDRIRFWHCAASLLAWPARGPCP